MQTSLLFAIFSLKSDFYRRLRTFLHLNNNNIRVIIISDIEIGGFIRGIII